MKKRIVSLLLVLILVLGMFPATGASAAATYDADAAIAYAKAHWNDGKGLCAEFVSRCVIAGGINIGVETGTGGCWRAIQNATGLKKQDLKLNSDGYATKALNGDNLRAGDVVVQWCKTHTIAPHILICGGYDARGYATFYAHNGALNNKRYNLGLNEAYDHTKACDMGGQVIRLTTLDPAVAGDSVTFTGTERPFHYSYATGVTFDYELSYTGTRPSEYGVYLGSSQSNMSEKFRWPLGGTANPYDIADTVQYLEHNTTYYYQFFAVVNGKIIKDSIKSFTTPLDSSKITVSTYQECGYRITIPAYQEVYCYNSPTSKDKYLFYEEHSEPFTLFCTRRYVMSDGTVRYYLMTERGDQLYFRFLTNMKSDTVHNYKDTIVVEGNCIEPGYTKEVCGCGESYVSGLIPSGHQWGSWTVVQQATATTDGSKVRSCSVCGRKETEVIPASGQPASNPFTDVKAGAYYYDPVLWAVNEGITTGTGNGTTFSPDMNCTRAQVVTFLWRAAGSPKPTSSYNPFRDVKAGAYYYDAVLWAVEKGITTGTGNGTTFSPDMSCTRSQVVTFLHRSAGTPAPTSSRNPFRDVASNAYYYNAVLWAVEKGITTGTGDGTTFTPEMVCSRGQIVTFLYRRYN
ncbi:MAG: hypothetical protein E7464_05515 [Ruminococcaceae bacterium]|nr:hypothetical protein [Oscillospiraceae bacterium]